MPFRRERRLNSHNEETDNATDLLRNISIHPSVSRSVSMPADFQVGNNEKKKVFCSVFFFSLQFNHDKRTRDALALGRERARATVGNE